jgi:hypothetical protein
MLRPKVFFPAWLLAVVVAAPLTAQRLQIGARFGYSPSTGTQFQMNDGSYRSWEGRAASVGVVASYWPLTHFGIQGTVDLRRTRAYETFPSLPDPFTGTVREVTFATSTTQLAASLRFAVRQTVGQRLQLAASLGPAMIRLGDAEYNNWYGTLSPYYLHRIAYGVVGGLSAAYALSTRLGLTLSAEDVTYQLQQKAVALPILTPDFAIESIGAPTWHEFTFSAAVSFRIL